MALSSGNILEVRTTGSDTLCSGGFNPTNSNMATDGAATSATGSSPVFTSASYSAVAGDAGAKLFIKSGTNWAPGWYPIVSVSAGAMTLDASVGAVVLYLGTTPLNTAAGCATTGSPTGATWSVDYSQQAAAQISYTDMVIGATPTQYTSVANVVGKNLIGNLIKITAGTGFTVQTVEVVSTSTITATCDKSLGSAGGTGGRGYLGGAYASLGLTGAIAVSGNLVWVKSGSYSVTSASTNVAGGCFSVGNVAIRGYGTTRGDGTRPTLTASGISTFTMISGVNTANTNGTVSDINIDGGLLTSSRGLAAMIFSENVKASNFTNSGIYNVVNATNCEATGCTTVAPAMMIAGDGTRCYSHDNTVTGCWINQAINCISVNNTGASSHGFDDALTIAHNLNRNCTAYGNGGSGIRHQNTNSKLLVENLIAYGNGAYGINGISITRVINCALGSNFSGPTNGLTGAFVAGTVALSADPFTAKASNNYSLNTTAGGGAACRAAGLPGAFPGGTTTGYLDIGAAQHQDSGGGAAGMLYVPNLDGV